MKKIKKPRGKQIGVSYGPEEMENLQSLFERSTCRTLSEYVRKRSLARPIQFGWRNQSFDGFVEEAVLLRKTMGELLVRPDWTQTEKEKLFALQAEVKAVITKIADVCTPT